MDTKKIKDSGSRSQKSFDPFDIILDDDEIKTVADEKDLESLEEYCYGKDYEEDFDEECFEFVYLFHLFFQTEIKLQSTMMKTGMK